MVGPVPNSLQELIGFGGTVRVRCRTCGREARFSPRDLSHWFRSRRQRDDWKTIRNKFVCRGWEDDGCGGRSVDVTYELSAPEPPVPPPVAAGADGCPPGIEPAEWAKADYYERKRMVRRLRS